jgi:hypothetical protein
MARPDVHRPAQQERASARAVVPDWRTAAAWWMRRELGADGNGLIRILDVCQVAAREAWVSLEAQGHHVVIGLRHEPVAVATTRAFVADDGWYRLLYLTVADDAPPPDRP